MRRIGISSDEHGAIGVLVAILMVLLLGFLALVVDVGRLYAEKAQLQNGADAAALAIAQVCGINEFSPICADDSSMATPLANANTNDAMSNVHDVAVMSASHQVEVVIGASETGLGPNEVSLFFANILKPFSDDPNVDYSKTEVVAKATASWGYPGSGTTMLPLIFQLCDFKSDGSVHWLSLKDNTSEGSETTSSTACDIDVPGNFHIVDAPQKSECGYFYAYGTVASSDPGMGKVADCSSLLKSRLGKIIYFPTFDMAKGAGNTGEFRIDGWVAFELQGFQFPGVTEGLIPAEAKGDAKFGLHGRFVKNATNTPDLDDDGANNYGTALVKLTK